MKNKVVLWNWVKFRIKRINSRSTASYDKNKDSAPEFGVKYKG